MDHIRHAFAVSIVVGALLLPLGLAGAGERSRSTPPPVTTGR
jgi:hypothetical protein